MRQQSMKLDLIQPDGKRLKKRRLVSVYINDETEAAMLKKPSRNMSADFQYWNMSAAMTVAEYKKRLQTDKIFAMLHVIWRDLMLKKLQVELPRQ